MHMGREREKKNRSGRNENFVTRCCLHGLLSTINEALKDIRNLRFII
jgi:hypothetical protein